MTTIEKQRAELMTQLESLNVSGYAGMSAVITLYDADGRARGFGMLDVPAELRARIDARITAIGC